MLFRSEFGKNIAKMATGTIASHLFWSLFILVSARLYTPEYFGGGQLFISVASILATVATGRYEMAIVVPRYRFAAAEILLFSVALSFLCVMFVLCMCLWGGTSATLFTGIAAREMRLMPVYVLELCLLSLFQVFLLREKLYSHVANGVVLFPAASFVLCLLFHTVDFLSVHKLVLTIMSARFVQILYYGFFLRGLISCRFWERISWKRILRRGKAYADFPQYMLAGSAVDALAYHMVPFFLTAFWGKETMGYYSMARQMLAAPASLIAHSVGRVFQQETGRLYGTYKECKAFYLKNFRLCLACSSVVCICAFAVVPTLLPLLLGGQWSIAGCYVRLMLPMTFVDLIASPLSTMYMAARRQRAYLGVQTAKLLGGVASWGMAGYVGAGVEVSIFTWGCVMAFISGVGIYGGKRIAEGK